MYQPSSPHSPRKTMYQRRSLSQITWIWYKGSVRSLYSFCSQMYSLLRADCFYIPHCEEWMSSEQLQERWLSACFCQYVHRNLCQLFQKKNITEDDIVSESVYKDRPACDIFRKLRRDWYHIFYFLSSILLRPKILLSKENARKSKIAKETS